MPARLHFGEKKVITLSSLPSHVYESGLGLLSGSKTEFSPNKTLNSTVVLSLNVSQRPKCGSLVPGPGTVGRWQNL